ncbi:OVA1 [Symbiodinium microadriaticum]|nr:OVA1 [Symbiodinium microadriaticum]
MLPQTQPATQWAVRAGAVPLRRVNGGYAVRYAVRHAVRHAARQRAQSAAEAGLLGLSLLWLKGRSGASKQACRPPRILAYAAASLAADAVDEALEGRGRGTDKHPQLQFKRDGAGNPEKLMITTPLFYANGSPHIGSAYPAIASDVLARYAKLRGADVHYVTGMDEHGEKIAQTAASKDKTPQELVDGFAEEFQELWSLLDVEANHFARTTPDKHKAIVREMWQRCLENGDIYKKDYTGWYCVGCEAYLDDDEMSEGHICKIHQKECIQRSEENYFFRLSKYWDDIRRHIENNPDFILPTSRRSQVLVWLEEDNKRDFSISRASTSWGIPVPDDDSQVIYVWFDALLGYLSSLLQPDDPATLETVLSRGWPAEVHVIGKDIMRFHAIYWPAMLMSAGLPLPKHICTHGFLTKDGLKMGKSLGNVVEPVPLVESFGPDAVRFFFAACLAFGEDGDFSYETFIKRVNSTLANELGNLVHRILTLSRKNLEEPCSAEALASGDSDLQKHPVRVAALQAPAAVARHYEQLDIPKAVLAAFEIVQAGNLRMTQVEPWAKLKKTSSEEDKKTALCELLVMAEGARICATLLSPVTPRLSQKILEEFGLEGQLAWSQTAWSWDAIPGLAAGAKPKPVFQRIDLEPWKGK